MNREIDNIFADVRNAFRLLNRYQERVLDIVNYIKEQTPFTRMTGQKWYSNPIKKTQQNDYAKLNVYHNMWGWDFLYGYIFEYYFDYIEKADKGIEMSIFQISDDGFFISEASNKHMTDIESFAPTDKSHSYLVLNVTIKNAGKDTELWLADTPYPASTPCKEKESAWKDFLTRFLSSSRPDEIIKGPNGETTILKKYEMQRFATQQSADDVIRDFARIIKEQTGVSLFKEGFYS